MTQNILFIIDGLPGGGAERVVLTLAGEMARRGQDVTIASLRDRCDYPIPQGVQLLVIQDTYRGPLKRQTEIRRRAAQLDQALRRHYAGRQVDLAVSNLPKTDRIVVACPFLKNAWLCLHCAIEAGQLQDKRGLKRWLKHRQLIRTYSGRKLITVCQALQQDVLKCGIRPAKMAAIYNPFDLEDIRRQAAEDPLQMAAPFLLHVGRMNSQKRHDRLLEAFSLSGYEGRLVLLGQGAGIEQDALQQQARQLGIEDQVVFAGFSTNPYRYMRAAQALVLSSDYEGFGNVLVEALICGTPVVSTRCPYGPDEIMTGDLARGLSELTAESLAAAIRRVVSAPPSIDQEELQRFTLTRTVDAYLALVGQ
ncbi:glycosyltransferase [Paludibacterium sp. THUN1379]|uniref:glycosyltransferase n=1 Tax=Paludibacterium sp. THUN1379 TaxID=3112107 RepID=UPI00308C5405|nr:glycosyltransferase [Paludibacterium sp. THUN1379]